MPARKPCSGRSGLNVGVLKVEVIENYCNFFLLYEKYLSSSRQILFLNNKFCVTIIPLSIIFWFWYLDSICWRNIFTKLCIVTEPRFQQKLFFMNLSTFFISNTRDIYTKLSRFSESSMKIKIRNFSRNIAYVSNYFISKSFCMETRLCNICKTTNTIWCWPSPF